MKNEYRVDISVRVRGVTPMDFCEFRSEHYDDLDEYIEAIKQFVETNITDYEEGENDEENEATD